MEVRAREAVVLAADFTALLAWYREALGFEVVRLFEEEFHYGLLESPSGIRLGIADAKEMGVAPADRGNNSVVLQFEVDDVKAFFADLARAGATIDGGPTFNPKDGFWFGSFSDPEGNPFWVVDKNCP
jgi:uncharacterized glyoxalase superfamily protein PhnB